VSVRRRFIPTLTAALTVLWCVSPATRGAGGDAMRLLPPHVTPKTADAIDRGLAFLARTQGRDGAWRNRTGYGGYPVAMSALAGLALLAGGNTTTQGPYAPNVDRVTDFLLGCRTPSGLIARMDEAEGRPMYGHGFATLFLAQVYGMTEDADRQARIREVLQRAVELTGRSQSPLGGWIYMPDGGGDEGSVTITQLQALRACRNAGIAVPKEVIDRALKYLELSFRSDGGIAYRARQSGPSRPPITAAAVCCWFNCGDYDNRGHACWSGVPGLAKTLLVSTLAGAGRLSFKRIQFTPDLMPADITGTEVIEEDPETTGGATSASCRRADLRQRHPGRRDQPHPAEDAGGAARGDAGAQVTGRRQTHAAAPFFVLATQNPIEQEGTYPLPEAQLDRFMFKVFVRYPTYEEEYRIAETTTINREVNIEHVFSDAEILRFQDTVRRIPAAPEVIRHALDLARMTRPGESDAPEIVRQMVTWGAGPRAVQAMLLGAKTRAGLHGRHHVSFEDVRRCAPPVLRHRIVTNFSASAEGYTPDRVIEELLKLADPHETVVSRDDGYNQLLSS
jgi:MoxR-like ATPase